MKPQLTISLLVSKHIHAVRKCLNSLVPILTQIPCELIIVDTSENECIRELALQYTPHVIPFHWCNDFSKARNVGIQMAHGEWFLFIDDDEWFENPSEIINFFTSGECKQYNSARYIVRSYLDWMGLTYTDACLNRMSKITSNTKFKNPIHEYLSPFAPPTKMFSAYVHHYGYAGKVLDTKTDRNIPMLQKELQEHEPTLHNCMQMAQEYLSTHEFKKAEKYARKALDIEDSENKLKKSWCLAYLPYMIRKQEEYQRAWETGKEMLRHPQCTELSSLRIYIDLIEICNHMENHEKDIIIYAKAYHQYLERINACPERWSEQSVGSLGEHHIKEVKDTIYFLGLRSAIQINDFDSAMFFLQCFSWENGGVEKLYPHLCSLLRDKNRENFPLHFFEQVDIPDPFIYIIKSKAAWKNNNQNQSEKYFKLAAKSQQIYILMEAALLSFQSKGFISLEPVMSNTDISQIENISIYLATNVETDQLPYWINLAKSYIPDFPIHALSMLITFQQKRLIEGVLEIEDSELIPELKQYCQWVKEYTTLIYSEKLLSSEYNIFQPPNYRFAIQMEQIFQNLENFNYPQVLNQLHEVINIYKPLCGVIRRMLSMIADEINQPEQLNSEFLKLATQVKQTIQYLLQKNRYEECLPLIEQLSTLLPRDLEVVRLRQRLWSHMGE